MTSQAPRHVKTIVGDNIAAARKARGLTQRELARVIETEGFAVSRWERGTVKPSDKNLAALATALGRDIAWFYIDHEAAAA